MGKRVPVTITYLEQMTQPRLSPAPRPPRTKLALMRVEEPPLHYYRYLYRTIGEPYKWVSRRSMPDAELSAIISDPALYLYVLYANGSPAGMAEIDARARPEIELRFFGLAPEWIGRGLGRFFLGNVLDLIWSMEPHRVRLETCTLDHPAALPLYQKHGFRAYDQRKGVIETVDD